MREDEQRNQGGGLQAGRSQDGQAGVLLLFLMAVPSGGSRRGGGHVGTKGGGHTSHQRSPRLTATSGRRGGEKKRGGVGAGRRNVGNAARTSFGRMRAVGFAGLLGRRSAVSPPPPVCAGMLLQLGRRKSCNSAKRAATRLEGLQLGLNACNSARGAATRREELQLSPRAATRPKRAATRPTSCISVLRFLLCGPLAGGLVRDHV